MARGVCDIDGDGKLVSVTEHTTIVKRGENAAYTEDNIQISVDYVADPPAENHEIHTQLLTKIPC